MSMPITWDELDDPELRPDRWTIRDAMERIRDGGDRFAAVLTDGQDSAAAEAGRSSATMEPMIEQLLP